MAYHCTPLGVAVFLGDLAATRTLLRRGADPNCGTMLPAGAQHPEHHACRPLRQAWSTYHDFSHCVPEGFPDGAALLATLLDAGATPEAAWVEGDARRVQFSAWLGISDDPLAQQIRTRARLRAYEEERIQRASVALHGVVLGRRRARRPWLAFGLRLQRFCEGEKPADPSLALQPIAHLRRQKKKVTSPTIIPWSL